MNERENVEYSFVGDVSSLRQATETAINLLGKYSAQVKHLADTDAFGKNKQAASSFQSQLKFVSSSVDKLIKKLGSLSDVKLMANSAETQKLNDALTHLNNIYSSIANATKLTTDQVRELNNEQKAAKDSFNEAGSGIDRLVREELKLQQALETVRRASQQTREVISSDGQANSNALAPFGENLSRVKDKFPELSNSAQAFWGKMEGDVRRASQALDPFIRLRFEEWEIPGQDKAINSHSKLSSIIEQLRNRFHKETEAVEEEDNKLKKKNKTITDSTNRHGNLKKILHDLGNSFNRESSRLSSFSSSFSLATKAASGLEKAIVALTGVKLGDWLAQGITQSIKYVENLNLFKVALGESVNEGLKFVDAMSEIYGMDPSNLYKYTGYFYQLTDAIGMADKASSTLSLSLTKASNDIASLFNVDIDTVVHDLASGMQGMARAVRKYGVDIRAVTLQQTAFNYGITTQVANMSEADRQALRYLTIMEQVRNATQQVVDPTVEASGVMGDFARNIETPANQLRIFKEQISQLGRAIGNFFIPIISKLLPILNGVIMALRTILTFLFSLTGFKMDFGGSTSGGVTSSIAGIGKAADGTSKSLKELKKTLAPFDEINLLQAPSTPSGGTGGGGSGAEGLMNPALEEAIKNVSLGLENIKMKANEVRDKLLEFFGFEYVDVFNPETGEWEKKLQWFSDKFRKNLIDKFPQWQKTIDALFDNWPGIISGLKKLIASIGEVWDELKKKIKSFLDSLDLDTKFSEVISKLPSGLNKLSKWISSHKSQIATFILLLGKIELAFKAFSAIAKYIQPLATFSAQLASVAAVVGEVVAPILAVAGAIYLLAVNSESFATSFVNLGQTIIESIEPIAIAIEDLATRVWNSLGPLWEEHIQPLVASIGDVLAPVIDTIGTLWQVLSELFQNTLSDLGDLWDGLIVPVISDLIDMLSALAKTVKKLWTEFVGPVIEHILKSLTNLWKNTISPIITKIGSIIGGLADIIMGLWNNVLSPVINWIVDVFGPSFTDVFNTIWDVICQVIDDIGDVVDGLLQILGGIIDFIAGVFTGDWKRAWSGIKNIFAGILNSMISVFEGAVNLIISGFNSLISFLWSGMKAAVNVILGTIEDIADFIGFDIHIRWTTPPPAIGYISLPRVEFAQGGVVTGPTNALIGEGHYDEAVIPLGNSPQMNEFANQIANKVNTTEQVNLLREQNQLLRQLIEHSGESVGIRDLTGAITRIQRQEARAGGY